VADEQQDPGAGDRPEQTPPPVSAGPADPAGDGTVGPDDAHVLPDEVEYTGGGSALPPAVERWRRRSATGAMLTGFAMGLREVIEPEHREPAIVLETSGAPPRDLAVEADLENLPPRQSVVKVRRWLLHDPDAPGAETAPGDVGPEPAAGAEKGESGAGPTGPTEIRQRRRPSRRNRMFGGKGS
jgi:hypothetical protein